MTDQPVDVLRERVENQTPSVGDQPRFSYWWKFVHNAVVHPLLAFPWSGPRWLERAHDWTADRCQGAG